MKKKIKVYTYTRVSTAMQIDGYSLEAQKNRMKAYADFNDYEIVGEYEDAGKSGKSIEGRTEFMHMMEDIKCGKDNISYVLVFKLSRFGRNAADVLSTLQVVSRPDFSKLMAEKINAEIDTTALQQEITHLEKQLRQQYAVKDKLMEEIDQLDPDDRHYQHRKSDLDDRLYKMYDKIDDTEELLIEARAKKQAIEADKVTRENIVGILTNFQRLYDVMNDAEKHDLMETLIADIQVYPQRQPNGQWLKSIHFKLPIIPEEEMQFGLDISDRDETVMSLVQQKPDNIVKAGIDAD